jgi:hypothetical protein
MRMRIQAWIFLLLLPSCFVTAEAQMDKLCEIFTDADTQHPQDWKAREKYVTDHDSLIVNPDVLGPHAALITAHPAEAYRLYSKLAQELKLEDWSCPAMKRYFEQRLAQQERESEAQIHSVAESHFPAFRLTAKGGTATLVIKDGFSASEIAEAIVREAPGAKCEISDTEVKVTGISHADLIKALAGIEVDEAVDDIDGAFAAIQNPMGMDDGSGSSIHATKQRTLPGMAAPKTETATKDMPSYSGVVLKVKNKRFPLVVLTVKTSSGEKLTVIPQIHMIHGIIKSDDKSSKQNLAAWYSRPGDQVSFKIVKKEKSFWVATDFDRAR